MRFITIPPKPIDMIGQDASDPPSTLVTSQQVFEAMFRSQHFLTHLDLFATYDLRKKLVGAKPGETVEVRDDEHAALAVVCKKPPQGLFNSALLYSPDAIDFFRAIVDAPAARPEPAKLEAEDGGVS